MEVFIMKKSKKKSSQKGLIGLAVVVVVLGVILIPRMNKEKPYSEEQVKKGNIETYYTFSGNVDSKNRQQVMAEKVMQISEIKVEEDSKVEKDDILFETSQGDEIKAKVSGTVSKIYIQEDEAIMSGGKLCDIIDFDDLEVTIKIDEYDLSSVEVGKEATVTIGAVEKEVVGKLSDISDTATIQNGVAYFTATLDLEKDSKVKVGMSAEAKILNKSAKDILMIPMKVLKFNEEDEPYVFIKDENNRPVEQLVGVGINDGKEVEITEGVSQGQVIMYEATSSPNKDVSGFRPPIIPK